MRLDEDTSANRQAAGLLTLRAAVEADAPFVDWLTRQTMEPVVRQTWTSEADVAAYFDKNRCDLETTKIIQWDGVDVGRLSLIWSTNEVYVDQVHVIPAYQGYGLGTAVLERVIRLARRMNRSVRLQCLLANPAANLYFRLGFEEYNRSATHYFLRIAKATGPAHREGVQLDAQP